MGANATIYTIYILKGCAALKCPLPLPSAHAQLDKKKEKNIKRNWFILNQYRCPVMVAQS